MRTGRNEIAAYLKRLQKIQAQTKAHNMGLDYHLDPDLNCRYIDVTVTLKMGSTPKCFHLYPFYEKEHNDEVMDEIKKCAL